MTLHLCEFGKALMRLRIGRPLLIVFPLILLLAGCGVQRASEVLESTPTSCLVRMSAREPWTDTRLDVPANAVLEIAGEGEVEICRWNYFGRKFDCRVGPKGTYVTSSAASDGRFPIPAGQRGPAPAYALIGRIGEKGRPFFIGGGRALRVEGEGGRLFVGINDFNHRDNKGAFTVRAAVKPGDAPVEPRVDPRGMRLGAVDAPAPVRKTRVLVIYVDGLRPDVMREMAFNGYLPNIRRYFIEQGADLVNAFTVFPASTLPANGAFWTGTFPARNGIVGGILFDRTTREIVSLYDKWSPVDAADMLTPKHWRRAGVQIETVSHRITDDGAAYRRFFEDAWKGQKAIWDYFPGDESEYHSTQLPIVPTPMLPEWVGRAVNTAPLLRAYRAGRYIDEINAEYAARYILNPRSRVMVVWLPALDATSHDSPRGQYGGGRKAIQKADRLIGSLFDMLREREMLDDTRVFLVSDHGHVGGSTFINQGFDVAKEFLNADRVDADGDGALDAGSGLGLNVRIFKNAFTREGSDKRDYVFLHDGGGETRMVFPFARSDSRDFNTANRLHELAGYSLAGVKEPVNLIERLLAVDLSRRNQFAGRIDPHPVDLAMLALDETRVLLCAREGVQGIIEKQGTGRASRYRYLVVRKCRQDADGKISYDDAAAEEADPLGLLEDAGFAVEGANDRAARSTWMREFHDRDEWLWATAMTRRPDAVVGVAELLLWDPSQSDKRKRYACDLMLTSSLGWKISHENTMGSEHGYLLREANNVVFMARGPGIRRNAVVARPVRATDLFPTIMEMAGVEYDLESIDGRPLRCIYDTDARAGDEKVLESGAVSPVMTDGGLSAAKLVLPNRKGWHIHDPDSFWDLHSIAANIMGIRALEIEHLGDLIVDTVLPGDDVKPFSSTLRGVQGVYHANERSYPVRRFGQLVGALRLREFNVADVIAFSAGGAALITTENWLRVNLLVDWAQDMLKDAEAVLASPIGRKDFVVTPCLHGGIDGTQWGAEQLRRGVFRELARFVDNALDVIELGIGGALNALPIPKPENRD